MSGIPERVWKLKLPCHVDNAIMKHMETIIKKIDRNQIDQEIMEEAGMLSGDIVSPLKKETNELVAMIVASIKTKTNNLNHKSLES